MLQAVLLDFNGTIINDEPIHKRLIHQLLQQVNLPLNSTDYGELCMGRSDRACLTDLWQRQGQVLSDRQLQQLLAWKARAYQAELEKLETLPLYPDVPDFIFKLRSHQVKLAIVTGARRSEVKTVLERTQLDAYFSVIVAGDEISASKPDPEGYLSAIDQLSRKFPKLKIQAADCLAIEDTFAGIEAAKRAGLAVVGVANTYPFHMLQRQTNWTVDRLIDLELERVQAVFEDLEAGVKR
jgi:HAD superfamily hydrolase (TIGR01509 family)